MIHPDAATDPAKRCTRRMNSEHICMNSEHRKKCSELQFRTFVSRIVRNCNSEQFRSHFCNVRNYNSELRNMMFTIKNRSADPIFKEVRNWDSELFPLMFGIHVFRVIFRTFKHANSGKAGGGWGEGEWQGCRAAAPKVCVPGRESGW